MDLKKGYDRVEVEELCKLSELLFAKDAGVGRFE